LKKLLIATTALLMFAGVSTATELQNPQDFSDQWTVVRDSSCVAENGSKLTWKTFSQDADGGFVKVFGYLEVDGVRKAQSSSLYLGGRPLGIDTEVQDGENIRRFQNPSDPAFEEAMTRAAGMEYDKFEDCFSR
jgi:hypothetical protein